MDFLARDVPRVARTPQIEVAIPECNVADAVAVEVAHGNRDYSVGLLIQYGNFRYFIGGDMHLTTEGKIAAQDLVLDVDLYQAIYKTLVLTGLRLGELAAIRVCDVVLDGPNPHIVLDARQEKNRQFSHLPLRADLCRDLTAWIARGGGDAQRALFAVSPNLVKVFDRDLQKTRFWRRAPVQQAKAVTSGDIVTRASRKGRRPRIQAPPA